MECRHQPLGSDRALEPLRNNPGNCLTGPSRLLCREFLGLPGLLKFSEELSGSEEESLKRGHCSYTVCGGDAKPASAKNWLSDLGQAI